MEFKTLLFYIFSAVTIFAALRVITARNPVHAVLFLFVVMMLDINIERVRQGFWNNLPLGALVGLLMVGEMAVVLSGRYFGLASLPPQNLPANYSNTKELARVLYT